MSPSRRHFLWALLATAACTASPVATQPGRQPRAHSGDPTPPPRTDPVPDAPNPDAPAAPRPTREPLSDAQLQTASAGLNAFAFDLHAKAATADHNAISSPMSVALALAMVHAGAAGPTADEIAKALHQPTDDATLPNAAATLLARYAETSSDYELSIVDRLFGDRRVPFEAAFLADAERTFRAPLETMDFATAPEPAREHINAWVAEQTHDRIEDLMPPGAVTPATKLVLVNAIYFKAAWMEPFPEYATREATFFGPRGEVTAKMMQRTGSMRWGASADGKVELVELPYGDDGRFAMTIALPRARDGLTALERGLDEATWSTWIEGMSHERVALSLPRFRIEMPEPLRLAKILQSLGIERAFDYTRADFTKMAPADEQLEISEGFHKAFIEVDEKGTEAAAATALGMRAGSAMPTEPPKRMRCDHPFAFAIRDTGTSAILFFGHVADPTA